MVCKKVPKKTKKQQSKSLSLYVSFSQSTFLIKIYFKLYFFIEYLILFTLLLFLKSIKYYTFTLLMLFTILESVLNKENQLFHNNRLTHHHLSLLREFAKFALVVDDERFLRRFERNLKDQDGDDLITFLTISIIYTATAATIIAIKKNDDSNIFNAIVFFPLLLLF